VEKSVAIWFVGILMTQLHMTDGQKVVLTLRNNFLRLRPIGDITFGLGVKI